MAELEAQHLTWSKKILPINSKMVMVATMAANAGHIPLFNSKYESQTTLKPVNLLAKPRDKTLLGYVKYVSTAIENNSKKLIC